MTETFCFGQKRGPSQFVERGRSPKLAVVDFVDGGLVAAAKSAGLSPVSVESYNEKIRAGK